jgi:6-pyruvoyl tetrahydropterin synthase
VDRALQGKQTFAQDFATFVVEAELRRDAFDADGIICDIGRSLDLLKTVLAEFDYRSLDEFAEFRGRNTTREFLACEAHKRLVRRIEEGALGSQAHFATANGIMTFNHRYPPFDNPAIRRALLGAVRPAGPRSHTTLCWREADSNSWSRSRG